MLKKIQTLKHRTTAAGKHYFKQIHSLLHNRRLKVNRVKKLTNNLGTKPRLPNLNFIQSLSYRSRGLIVTRPLKKKKTA